MLSRVEAVNVAGNKLVLPLSDDLMSGFILNEVEGLDPVKAQLVSSSFAQADGEQFHTSRRDKRQLKLKLDLAPDYSSYSVRDLRTQLYSFFMPKTEVLFRFQLLNSIALEIRGRVEEFVSPLFTPDPTAEITVVCFDPDFIDPNPYTRSGVSTVDPEAFTSVLYPGTVETGFLFTLNVTSPINQFFIHNSSAIGGLQALNFGEQLYAGDKIQISTVAGNKYALLTRNGATESILRAVHQTSRWIELFPGENQLRVSASVYGLPFDISYTIRYGGL